MFGDFCPTMLGMRPADPGVVGYNWQASAGAMAVPAHLPGDLLVFNNYDNSSGGSIPSTTSGFTSLASLATDIFLGNTYVGSRLQWRSSDGTVTSLTCTDGGVVFVVRGFSSIRGALAGTSGITGITSLSMPNLTGLNTGGTSMILAGCNELRNVTACTSPFVLTDGRHGKVMNNTAANTSSKSFTQASGAGGQVWVAECVV